ncbi:hypothetical protein [Streptacidiphilus sp. P02-A3a]|uniref:hypothetical protein n=1 Tax=Streptacidiphilus sp. P02-A3a TaxID=2704468 RepID=UPI001CDC9DBD|nr:hypothetical protein [Streptacidiphilus sp. P02-A3a]
MSIEVTQAAVERMVSALSGRAAPEDLATGFSHRLASRGDMGAAFFTGNTRFAAFRLHDAQIEGVVAQGPWSARATVRTGPDLWELDVTVEPDPLHPIRRTRSAVSGRGRQRRTRSGGPRSRRVCANTTGRSPI